MKAAFAAVIAASAVVALPIAPAAADTGRTEVVQEVTDGVRVSLVRLRDPLPRTIAPIPAGCDNVEYLRYTQADAPTDPQQADAVIFGAPGVFLGGYGMDRLARNTVAEAAARGRSVEYWTYVPRSVCAFDTHGIDAAWRAQDWRLAWDYYFAGGTVEGKRFAGFPANEDLGHLVEMGAKRFASDLNFILRHELPDPEYRRTRAFCGGHSDGGLWFGVMGAWDFGGGEANAGYQQCAGFWATGSLIDADWLKLRENPVTATGAALANAPAYEAKLAALRSGAMPRNFGADTPVIDPRWWTLLAIAGNAAYFHGDEESKLPRLIASQPLLADSARLLFSRTWTDAVTGTNSIDTFRFTNEALLGVIQAASAINANILATSFGTLCGGPVAEKTMPWNSAVPQSPLLGYYLGGVTGEKKRIGPTDHNVVYRWCNYDEFEGIPFAEPDREFIDVHDYAGQLARPYPGFFNPLLPNRWFSVDQLDGLIFGTRTGDLAAMKYESELRAKPIVTVFGTDDLEGRLGKELGILPADTIWVHGYTHFDPPFGAATQNNGKPEPFTEHLMQFFCSRLPDRCG